MRVLIVDDSPMERMILRSAVERLDHQCVEAEDGEAAWDAIAQMQFDVILTDWVMPNMTGPELCRRIRAREDAPYVYIVLCTALADRAHGLEGVRAGADSFLTKPIDLVSVDMCLIAAERVLEMQRQLSEQNARLGELNELLAATARTDALTGLGNRLRLSEDLEKIADQVRRYDMTLGAAMCDLDRFKAYNDRFGHLVGDDALRRVAQIVAGLVRTSDSVYRYGGEEILILFPQQSMESTQIAVERLRQAVEAAQIPHPDNQPFGVVTVSIGVAMFQGSGQQIGVDVLRLADEALYEAKRSGRNRVELSPPVTATA